LTHLCFSLPNKNHM